MAGLRCRLQRPARILRVSLTRIPPVVSPRCGTGFASCRHPRLRLSFAAMHRRCPERVTTRRPRRKKGSQEVGPPGKCNPFPCAPDRDRLSVRSDRGMMDATAGFHRGDRRHSGFIAPLAARGAGTAAAAAGDRLSRRPGWETLQTVGYQLQHDRGQAGNIAWICSPSKACTCRRAANSNACG
jgi:hypothetical protein